MPTNEEIHNVLRELKLNRYFVGGTAALQLRGLVPDNSVPDVDIVLQGEEFQHLKKTLLHWDSKIPRAPKQKWDVEQSIDSEFLEGLFRDKFCIFPTTNFEDHVEIDRYMMNAEYLDGYWVLKIDDLINWKRIVGRPKDLIHIEMIKEILSR